MDYKDEYLLNLTSIPESSDIQKIPFDDISDIKIEDIDVDNINDDFEKLEKKFNELLEWYRKHLIYIFDILDINIEELKSFKDFENIRVINISKEIGSFIKADNALKKFIDKCGVLYNLMPILYIDPELDGREYYVV